MKIMDSNKRNNEIWKDVIGYEGIYQVSNYGRIKSFSRTIIRRGYLARIAGRILKPCKNRGGYLMVVLSADSVNHSVSIHSLVAEAFLPNPENKRTVNHKNGIRDDNRLDNLEWATHSENNLHAYRNLGRKHPLLGKFGKDNPTSKPVLQSTKDGVFMNEYGGTAEASRETGIIAQSIYKCCHGRGSTAGGYIWQFK